MKKQKFKVGDWVYWSNKWPTTHNHLGQITAVDVESYDVNLTDGSFRSGDDIFAIRLASGAERISAGITTPIEKSTNKTITKEDILAIATEAYRIGRKDSSNLAMGNLIKRQLKQLINDHISQKQQA